MQKAVIKRGCIRNMPSRTVFYSTLDIVANKPHFGSSRRCLLGPIVISVYGYLFLACYLPATALDKHRVLKSLVTSGYDRTIR